MQTTTKLIFALAAALAAPGAFAAADGIPDNDWLMKKPVPSAMTGAPFQPAAASAPAPADTKANAGEQKAQKPFVSSEYNESEDGLP
ncbi:MAG: hypothetical protein JWN73_592 [Betaproteobacteria bacterium]|nr:hypothetical protein [Betaproteobacteria bacterium]